MSVHTTTLHIRCVDGPTQGSIFEINEAATIGREPNCCIHLEDPKISRVHGTFTVRDGVLHYQDNKSTNGSYLNGARITEAIIDIGDTLRVGSTHLALCEHTAVDSIHYSEDTPQVTSVISTKSVQADALAQKFSEIFDYYKDHQPELSKEERFELVRTQKALNGLKNLFGVSQHLTRLMPVDQLLTKVGESLFEVFAGTENLVILLMDPEEQRLIPKHSASRSGLLNPQLSISRTVMRRAVAERSTIIANETPHDDHYLASDSLINFELKGVICAPLVSNEDVLGVLYLDNRIVSLRYDDFDAEILTAFANQVAVAIANARLCDDLQQHYHQTLQALVNAIEAKDSYTKGHTERVCRYAIGIARQLGLPEDRVGKLKTAADLHDIGKIGVREGIINKEGKLTDTEYHRIQDHIDWAERILAPILYLQDILPFIRAHHERWDGSGYPDGLKGEQAPLEARILAVADSFDAMTTKRSYNDPMSFEKAFQKILEDRGTKYDPQVVDAFDRFLQREQASSTHPGGLKWNFSDQG